MITDDNLKTIKALLCGTFGWATEAELEALLEALMVGLSDESAQLCRQRRYAEAELPQNLFVQIAEIRATFRGMRATMPWPPKETE